MRKWFDEIGLMRAYEGEDSVNGLLFTAYAVMTGAINPDARQVNEWLIVHIKSYITKYPDLLDLKIKQTWRDPDGERDGSHDEMTAFFYLSKKFGFSYHKKVDLSPYKHPRDFAWYRMQRSARGKLLSPIYSLVAITTCYRKQYNKKAEQYDTDGKLLYLSRRELSAMPITDFICDKLLEWRWGKSYMKALFDIYFWHSPEHPIRRTL